MGGLAIKWFKMLINSTGISSLLNYLAEFIQQLSNMRSEFEWDRKTTGKSQNKRQLADNSEFSVQFCSQTPLRGVYFTDSLSRTDMHSLTRNKRCPFQRRIQKCWNVKGMNKKKTKPHLHSLAVCVTLVERCKREICNMIYDPPMVQRVCTCTCQTTKQLSRESNKQMQVSQCRKINCEILPHVEEVGLRLK